MNEIVYVLINAAMPWYVKVGFTTTSVEQRLRELDTTSVPLPFECYYAARVQNVREVEKLLHDAFLDHRIRSNREFFRISPDRVVAALRLTWGQDVTPGKDTVESEEDQKALDEARKKRSVFNFEMVDIPVGAILTFVNDETITAKVLDNRYIDFKGEVTSLSEAAWKVLWYKYRPQWTIYWMYDWETLDERRNRMESGE